MLETLLRTKLYVPPLRPNRVPRPHLIRRLNQGLQFGHKLTLVSAPAGFGKTTLVSEWVNQKAEGGGMKDEPEETNHPSSFIIYPSKLAWLSLDEGDNDPARFLAYLVAALQTITPDIGQGVMGVLQSPQPPAAETILTVLLNEMTTIPDNFILVLDDYHIVESQEVDKALTFFLDNLPPQVHLVITSRIDPSIPLSRLRASGQMTEMREADLRFSRLIVQNATAPFHRSSTTN